MNRIGANVMSYLSQKELLESVNICLELGYNTKQIIEEVRRHTGDHLIGTLLLVFDLLAMSDHAHAKDKYESMKKQFTRLANAPGWEVAHKRHTQ